MPEISQTAIHYIYLQASKYKYKDSKRNLPKAINHYLLKHHDTDNMFLSSVDTKANYNQIIEAYINYSIEKLIKDSGKYKDWNAAINCICQDRFIDINKFKTALLKRGIT